MSDTNTETTKLHLTIPTAINMKLMEVANALHINKTAALVMAVNSYHAQVVKPPQQAG